MESSFIIPLALLLLSALIGVVIKQNTRQADKTDTIANAVNKQEVTLARVDATVSSVVSRVDDLHRWKNQQQERESADLRRTIDDMRREREETR